MRLASEEAARRLVRRASLVNSIHELWGSGATIDELHASVQSKTSHLWDRYMSCSFKLSTDSFQGSRDNETRLRIINSFAYLDFKGPIRLRDPDEEFIIFEDWPYRAVALRIPDPNFYYFGRYIAKGARDLSQKYDLKKRVYISTTSMDAELALVTANMVLAAPGKIVYDPFVGTGSLPVACAHFGAMVWGSDIDGRAFKGLDDKKNLKGNFEQYGLLDALGDNFAADLVNTPIRRRPLRSDGDGTQGRLFDGIVCDPPYGVREGLRVLGVRDPEKTPWSVAKGKIMYKLVFVSPLSSHS